MIESPECTLSIYGISKRGFLPEEVPLEYLSDPYFQPWERIIQSLPELLENGDLRSKIDLLPDFEIDRLRTEAVWRRSYVIFSFLTHAYIWGGYKPAESLPPQLSLPFSAIAEHFALPTTAAYAATNLWNWRPVTPNADITVPENVKILQTFTGTPDEAWFYLISVSIEAKGGSIIPTMLECFEAIRCQNVRMVAECLNKISECLRELGTILDRMHERCDPSIFYHRIRPFLAGSKGMAKAGLPNGVFYDDGRGTGRWRQYSGGSNAQSSLIQLFDAVLGVVHQATGDATTTSEAVSVKPKQIYIMEMRNYMPGSHRHFLSHVSSIANIKQYIMRDDCEPIVRLAYQAAINSLTVFRDKHIRIVSRYIIIPAQHRGLPEPEGMVNIATASQKAFDPESSKTNFSGTGGTNLMPFLKQTRHETKLAGLFP